MNKRFGRFVVIVLAAALILSAFPLVTLVFAEPTEIGSFDQYKAFFEVEGNATNPEIEIEITADFEITDSAENDFSGKINGNGHVITLSSGSALFNNFRGEVCDLGVVATAPITTEAKFVGIFANAMYGTAENCFSYGTIDLNYSGSTVSREDGRIVGGFCGALTEEKSITNSFSCVRITTIDASFVGGFAGIIRAGATIESCYSAGDIKADEGFVAGFANGDATKVSDTYTSCQIVNVSNDAKPSGVNGLYDNQLSLMRESLDNPGLSTGELIRDPGLSEKFVVTSTAYPALNVFYNNKWSAKARDVVEVSTAAAIFLDYDLNSSSREEPSAIETPRVDYLSNDSYVDRTNVKNLSWSVDVTDVQDGVCKIYDTVPTTVFNQSTEATNTAGTSADLLRSRLKFSVSDRNTKENKKISAILSATKNDITRKWHLNTYAANPYFNGGNGTQTTPFLISNTTELDHVRHYSLITPAHYEVVNDFEVGIFDPIVDFTGTIDGGDKTLSNVTLADDRDGNMGLFANTRDGSTIQNITLSDVTANSEKGKVTGMLIGSANNTTVTNVVIQGTKNSVTSAATAGGVIGTATNSTLTRLLVSVEADGQTVGGLVGVLDGGSLSESGVTGLVGGTGATLGGLVGEASNKAAITNCYSTATVLSDTAGATAGGLVGVLNDSSVSSSYSAALAAVKDNEVWSQAKPLVGSGTAGDGCSYDGQFYDLDEMKIVISDNTFTGATTGHYPQLKCFESIALSQLSTVKFIYQQYWEDTSSDDVTTGFIPNTFAKPTVASDFCSESDIKLIYAVETTPGYGFEPASGVRFAAVRTQDAENAVGVRYATALRDDLIPIFYEISGNSNDIKNSPVFIELSYSKDKTTWSNTQLRVLTDDISDIAALYDIPKGCYIRVRIRTEDNTDVLSVAVNESTLISENGYYTSAVTFDNAASIVISLRETTPSWGVHRLTF